MLNARIAYKLRLKDRWGSKLLVYSMLDKEDNDWRKIKIATGLSVLNTTDGVRGRSIQSGRQFPNQDIESHEIAFILDSTVGTSDWMVVQTNLTLLVSYARKMGFNIVSTVKTLDSDVQIKSSDEVNSLLYKSCFIGGRNNLTIEDSLLLDTLSKTSEKATFGRYVREMSMKFANHRGMIYGGYGDEHESLFNSFEFETQSRHYNISHNSPYTYLDKTPVNDGVIDHSRMMKSLIIMLYSIFVNTSIIVGSQIALFLDEELLERVIVDTDINKWIISSKDNWHNEVIITIRSIHLLDVSPHKVLLLPWTDTYYASLHNTLIAEDSFLSHYHPNISREDIERWLTFKNVTLWKEQERRIVMLGAYRSDALQKPKCDEMYFGLFSVSNSSNVKPKEYLEWFNRNIEEGFVLYPSALTPPHDVLVLDGVAREDQFSDWVTTLEAHTFTELYGWTMAEWLTFMQNNFSLLGTKMINVSTTVDMSHELMKYWLCFGKISNYDTRFQTWMTSQTHHVKKFSNFMRSYFGISTNDLHIFRYTGLQSVIPEVILIKNNPVIQGFKIVNGKRRYYSVSGHLVNLMLACDVENIDLSRYLDSVEGNVRAFSDRNKKTSHVRQYREMIKQDMLAESNWHVGLRMWHSYHDYLAAVSAYIQYSIVISGKINIHAVLYTSLRLANILRAYPFFLCEGWESLDFQG